MEPFMELSDPERPSSAAARVASRVPCLPTRWPDGGDRRAAERGEGSNDSRHEQMDSCICSEGIRFLEAPWRATTLTNYGTYVTCSFGGGGSILRAPGRPVDLDRYALRVGSR